MSAVAARFTAPRLPALALATVVVAFGLIVLGAVVRTSGSGMGCGDDWPTCNGEVVPTFDRTTAIEYAHRAVAGVVLALTVALVVVSRGWSRARGPLGGLTLLALALVLAQAGLGAVTVVTELEPGIVMLHLGLAEAYFATTIVMASVGLRAEGRGLRDGAGAVAHDRHSSTLSPQPSALSGLGWTALAALGAVYLLTLSGAYTATSAAAWACPEWPGCHGHYLPAGTAPVDIHLLHRWLALAALVGVLATAAQAWRLRDERPATAGVTLAVLVVMLAQMLVGAANIWFELAGWVSVLHLANATLIIGGLVLVVALEGRGLRAEG